MFHWDYGRTVETNRWFFAKDYRYWLAPEPGADPLIQVVDEAACETPGPAGGTCLGGYFWLHADTDVGAAAHGAQLANTHFAWSPDELRGYCLERLLPRVLGAAATAIATDTSFSFGEILLPTSTVATDQSFDINLEPETELVMPAPLGILGALQHDGSLVSLSTDATSLCRGATFDSRVARAIREGLWRSAAEPRRLDHRFDDMLAVSISSDGTSVREGLVAGSLELASHTFVYRSLFDDRDTATGPAPRTGFAAIFSRIAGGVYLVGGRDSAGAPAEDAWFKPLGGDWSTLSLSPERLGDVVAATYAFGDDRLWVLDETDDVDAPRREQRRVRLMRVDPAGGGASRVFYVPRKRPHLASFLTVDRDGSVLLALADATRFSLLRLRRAHGQIVIGRARSEDGRLVRAPIVDDNGYSFVVQGEDGTLRVVRRRALVPVACDGESTKSKSSSSEPPPCDRSALEKLF